ncbi:MAG: hypothetical protein M1828_000650 [Chrysothrix sp. TS-e1954]|nr:MAG: hypothetical protein M1828_000650 [Chrysothrix sp. TS-e1954]
MPWQGLMCIAPETLAQAKRTLKGMFRKKSRTDNEAAPEPDFAGSSSAQSAQQGATRAAEPSTTSESTSPSAAAQTALRVPKSGESVQNEPAPRSMADEVHEAGNAAAASVESNDQPAPSVKDTPRATGAASSAAPKDESDVGSKDSIAAETPTKHIPGATDERSVRQEATSEQKPAAAANTTISPTSDTSASDNEATDEGNATPTQHPSATTERTLPPGVTPPMSATSGPLEDNPHLS